MLRANKHPLKDFTPTPQYHSSPHPFSALSLPLHSERAGSWDGGSAIKWWKHLSRLSVNIPDVFYCLFLDTNQQAPSASWMLIDPDLTPQCNIRLVSTRLPHQPNLATFIVIFYTSQLDFFFYPSLAVTDELTWGHQMGGKTIATSLILLPTVCICEWVGRCPLLGSWWIAATKWARIKMRREKAKCTRQ